jgi:hypothetical protein
VDWRRFYVCTRRLPAPSTAVSGGFLTIFTQLTLVSAFHHAGASSVAGGRERHGDEDTRRHWDSGSRRRNPDIDIERGGNPAFTLHEPDIIATDGRSGVVSDVRGRRGR